MAAHSRRQFIGGALPFLMAGRALATPTGEAPNRITTETDASRRLTVAAAIDGAGPFRFVVDTGADRTVLATDVAQSLGLAVGRQVMVEGIIRSVPANTVAIRKLQVGRVTSEDLRVPILPRALIEADGYLGLDVVMGRRVTLDFANGVLEIGNSIPAMFQWNSRPQESRIPVWGPAGHLRSLNCHLDGVHAAAFIDTGAEISVGNPSLHEMLIRRDQNYLTREVVPITGVTGGSLLGAVVAIRRVDLGSLSFTHNTIAIADLPVFNLWGLSDRPALLIGMNWLRNFASVSIDYGSDEVRFDLARLPVASSA